MLRAQDAQPGWIEGSLDEPGITAAYLRQIHLRRITDDHTAMARVAADGSFRSSPLAPGRYAVGLSVRETYPLPPPDRTEHIPLLGTGELAAGETVVTAGLTAKVVIPRPRSSTIEVYVTAGKRPAPAADVFWCDPAFPYVRIAQIASGPRGFDFHPDDAGMTWYSSRARTDARGRATFATLGPGTWDIYLRHSRGAATTGPYAVVVETVDDPVRLDLALPTSTIRGSLPRRSDGARTITAQLYRRALANDTPFAYHDLMVPQQWKVPHVELDADGTFAFGWLPADDWVVRFVIHGPDERILAQRTARTDGRATVELGDTGAATSVDAVLTCGVHGPAPAWGPAVRVQWLPPDGGKAVFLRNLWAEAGTLSLTGIAPGRYRVQRIEPEYFNGTWGLIGPPRGDAVEVVIDAKGGAEPRHVLL